MNNLSDLEKKINSELGTKINTSEIKHNQIYLEIDSEDLIDVVLFVKTNKDTKFRQLIDITVVDYPERSKRFKIVYLFLSHEFNQRMILSYDISENEVISSLTSIFPSASFTYPPHVMVTARYSPASPYIYGMTYHSVTNTGVSIDFSATILEPGHYLDFSLRS